MSSDKKTPKERIEEIKAKKRSEAQEKTKEKIEALKADIKEKKKDEEIKEVIKEKKVDYEFTDRQIIVHGEKRKAKAYFINYTPGKTHAVLQEIPGDVNPVIPDRQKLDQGSLRTMLRHAIKKVKNLSGGK